MKKRNFHTTEHPYLLQDDGSTEHPCSTCKFFVDASYCEKYNANINDNKSIQQAYIENDCQYKVLYIGLTNSTRRPSASAMRQNRPIPGSMTPRSIREM